MASVQLDRVRKVYDNGQVAVQGASFEVADGELMVLVGPSGCGKSTLLRMIAGLEDISGGTLSIGDRVVNDVAPKDRDIAMVFQSYALYPHMTVAENLAFGLKLRKHDKATIEQRVGAAAQTLGLTEMLGKLPREMSGGQRQRVALGRALVREPSVFLLDEPLSNLDAKLRHSVRTEIARLHRQLGTTMIYVTHDQVEAMTMADKIVVLRAGRIEQVGTPLDLYNQPRNQFVAGFIGSPRMNFVPATQLPQAQAGAVTVGIRPEHAQLADDGQLQLQVTQVEQLGANSILHGHVVPDAPFEVILPGQTRIQRGDTVRVAAPPEYIHCFDQNGLRI